MGLHFVKIVRDRIGDLADPGEVVYQEAPSEQVVAGLRKKLVEEALEYLLDPSAEELADVQEVVDALRRLDLKMYHSTFASLQDAKRQERGGFDRGVGLFVP